MSDKIKIPEGVYYDLTSEQYHASDGVSCSMLKELDRSPAHLQAMLLEPKKSEALTFGLVFHQLVLEPEKPAFWTVKPSDLDGRTKKGKAWLEANQGQSAITQGQFECAIGMSNAIRRHETAGRALRHGKPEVSVYRMHHNGLLRRARIDWVSAGNCLVDLKTCEDARPYKFAKNVAEYHYAMQAAYYLDIWNDASPENKKERFVFIAIEKVPPFGLIVYELDDASMEKGRGQYYRNLAIYKHCQDSGEWPCYDSAIQKLTLPKWALTEFEI